MDIMQAIEERHSVRKFEDKELTEDVIKAVGAGTCYVYVYSHKGISKKITVTVK